MINCDYSYMRVFTGCSGNEDLLNHIHGINIVLSGNTEHEASSNTNIVLESIEIGDTVDIVLTVDVPVMGIDTKIRTSGTFEEVINGVTISIQIKHDIPDTARGVYRTDASIRLKYIKLILNRKIMLCGKYISIDEFSKISDGYNVAIDIKDGVMSIVGGPGQGKGRYKGSEVAEIKFIYSGLKSINGLRRGRNIDVYVSDLLHSYGAGFHEEKVEI